MRATTWLVMGHIEKYLPDSGLTVGTIVPRTQYAQNHKIFAYSANGRDQRARPEMLMVSEALVGRAPLHRVLGAIGSKQTSRIVISVPSYLIFANLAFNSTTIASKA